MAVQLVDPRVVYQLVHFAQRRGAKQFQGEQLLKVLEAFEDCRITDAKAWTQLGTYTLPAKPLLLVVLRALVLILRVLLLQCFLGDAGSASLSGGPLCSLDA